MLDKFAGERKKWRESRFVIAMKDKMGNNEISTISKKMLGDMIVSQNRKLSDAFLLKMEGLIYIKVFYLFIVKLFILVRAYSI